jgi:hypothetical protein
MSSSHRTRHAALLLLATLLPAGRVAAQDEGISLVTRTTTTSSGPLPAPAAGNGRMIVQGSRIRMESADTIARPPFPASYVMLSLDGGMRTVVLDPARREYFTMDVSKMLGGLADMQKSNATSMRITDPAVRLEHVGPGERMLDQATDHWRITQRLTMTMGAGASAATMRSVTITDYWLATSTRVARSMELPNLVMPMFDSRELERQLADVRRQMPNGVPLRTVTTTSMSHDGQDMSRSTSTTDVTELSRAPLPASTFEIPADYREVPFPVPGVPAKP